jgi:hypothetical protein
MKIEAAVPRGAFMAYTFDSLGYAKRLRGGGVPQEQAEAHAEAARDFIMAELATKADLLATKQELQNSIDTLKNSMEMLKNSVETRMNNLETRVDTLGLRLTLRLGAIVVVALGALATILKLT